MAVDDKIRHGKLQYDINREAALASPSASALSSGKILHIFLSVKHLKKNKNNWRSRRKANKGTWRKWGTTS